MCAVFAILSLRAGELRHPLIPPKYLVAKGLYRFVRNPMYLGVITTLLGIATIFSSIPLLTHIAAVWGGFHLFVLFYEEPTSTKVRGCL